MFGFLFLAPCARTTRYEEAFLPKGKKRPHYHYYGRAIPAAVQITGIFENV